jgi:ribosomal protein S18 acetylase RimI-like enzyme
MVDILRADDFGESCRPRVAELFVAGFGKHFTHFSRDPVTLAKAFEHMFVLDVFYLAALERQIVGMAACTDARVCSIDHDKKQLVRHFGFLKGRIANYVLDKAFRKPPVDTSPGVGSAEFFVTAPEYQGRGIASALVRHIVSLPDYAEFVLEVADTNTVALNLYASHGFKEFKRVKRPFARYSGVNALVYMRYRRE